MIEIPYGFIAGIVLVMILLISPEKSMGLFFSAFIALFPLMIVMAILKGVGLDSDFLVVLAFFASWYIVYKGLS